jgi:hypothetical protein
MQKVLNDKGFSFRPQQSEMPFERKLWSPFLEKDEEGF